MSRHRSFLPSRQLRLALNISVLCAVTPQLARADGEPAADTAPEPPPFVLKSEVVAPPLADGRKVTIQIGEAVEYVPPVEAAALPAEEPGAARPRPHVDHPAKTRLLTLSATTYPGTNWTLLSWWQPAGEDGPGRQLRAWSRADYGGLPLTDDFDIPEIDTRFLLFPTVTTAGESSPPVPLEVLALPATHPGFVTVDETADAPVMAPARALHAIHRVEGAELAAKWRAAEELRAAEAAQLEAAPPPLEDVVIKIRPLVESTEAVPQPGSSQ